MDQTDKAPVNHHTKYDVMPDGVAKVMDTEEWQHEAGREDRGESQLDVALLLPLVHILVSQLIIYQAITRKKDDRISSTQLTAGVKLSISLIGKDIYKNICKFLSH